MAIVYLAEDLRHRRQVALKRRVAPERLLRQERPTRGGHPVAQRRVSGRAAGARLGLSTSGWGSQIDQPGDTTRANVQRNCSRAWDRIVALSRTLTFP
jgi:hypothetical protein